MTRPDHCLVIPPDFDAAYRADPDPWDVESSWYERRKLALTLAALPRQKYASAWEPGCGPGITSRQLAQRVDRLVASDASIVAVDAAIARTAELPHVTVLQSALPEVPLAKPVDLVVATEFLYYVEDWETAVEALWSSLLPGGHLVFVHWAHQPHDAYRSGREMHAMIASDAAGRGVHAVVTHTDPDFTIDVHENVT